MFYDLFCSRANDIAYTDGSGTVKGHCAMRQLRTVSIVVAIVASVLGLISGAILFFVIEPPFLASIFLACAAIGVGCFIISGLAAYFSEDDISD